MDLASELRDKLNRAHEDYAATLAALKLAEEESDRLREENQQLRDMLDSQRKTIKNLRSKN